MGVKVRERPKGSGVYWVFIDHQGKRKAKKVGTKRDADALAGHNTAELCKESFKLSSTQDGLKYHVFRATTRRIGSQATRSMTAILNAVTYRGHLNNYFLPDFWA